MFVQFLFYPENVKRQAHLDRGRGRGRFRWNVERSRELKHWPGSTRNIEFSSRSSWAGGRARVRGGSGGRWRRRSLPGGRRRSLPGWRRRRWRRRLPRRRQGGPRAVPPNARNWRSGATSRARTGPDICFLLTCSFRRTLTSIVSLRATLSPVCPISRRLCLKLRAGCGSAGT